MSEIEAETTEHVFNPQTLGSAYCRECGGRFDTAIHGYVPALWDGGSNESVASDLLENLERDIAEERQYRREEFSEDWPL